MSDSLLKTLEAIVDNSELDSEQKLILCVRLAAIQLVDVNSESFSMELGCYKVELNITQ